MPDNNRKVISNYIMDRLNAIYNFSYDKQTDKIMVSLTTSSRVTVHDGNKPFSINAVRLDQKVTFHENEIKIWKELQSDPQFSKYSLFDVHNAVNKLRIMYQESDTKTVKSMLQSS